MSTNIIIAGLIGSGLILILYFLKSKTTKFTILVLGLVLCFAGLIYLGKVDREHQSLLEAQAEDWISNLRNEEVINEDFLWMDFSERISEGSLYEVVYKSDVYLVHIKGGEIINLTEYNKK